MMTDHGVVAVDAEGAGDVIGTIAIGRGTEKDGISRAKVAEAIVEAIGIMTAGGGNARKIN